MPTTTRTEAARTSIAVTRDGARVRLRAAVEADPGQPVLRPVLLSSDATSCRVALVPEGALLLAGDQVALEVDVSAGVHLEIVEPGGTVAYDMRGGCATWEVSLRVHAGGTLVWHGEPFVVASGAEVTRSTDVVLGPGARVAIRETLALGRYGEPAGRLRQRLLVVREGVPVLVEEIDLGASTAPALLGGRRCLGSIVHVGLDVPADADTMLLEAGGALVRRLGAHAHEVQPERAWRSILLAARS